MTEVIADSSAIAALLFGEAEGASVVEALGGRRIVAPILLAYEIANVCVSKCRRHPDQRRAYRAGLRSLSDLGIELFLVDEEAVVELALEVNLAAYDASYLWLARQLGADLVTLDKELVRAAAALG